GRRPGVGRGMSALQADPATDGTSGPWPATPAADRPGDTPSGPVRRAGRGTSRQPRRRRWRIQLRRDWPLIVMTLPAVGFVALFHYLPTLGNVIAFQDYNPFLGDNPLQAFLYSEWIGFGNFMVLFQDPM